MGKKDGDRMADSVDTDQQFDPGLLCPYLSVRKLESHYGIIGGPQYKVI